MAKNIPFDGVAVKVVSFHEVGRFSRFFTENGEGYCKVGPNTCNDDYSLKEIYVKPTTPVFIKDLGSR